MAETAKYTFSDGAYVELEMALNGKYYLTMFDSMCEETHAWKYNTLEAAKKAFNNIINSYPDVKVN